MEIVYKNIDELIPYDNNPRKNEKSIKYVMESIKQFGFKVPVVIDKNNIVVCGHTRLISARNLNISKIPCIIANDLTEEQIKAFRIADNKVSEFSKWDNEKLLLEIQDINLDLGNFGIDIPEIDFNLNQEFELHEEYKETTRERVRDIVNLEKGQFTGMGMYDIPILEPVKELPEIKEWISFNYVLSDDNPQGKAVHFFIDDYQFERLWNNPEKYVDKLKQYVCVATPDFSPYGDMPHALQIYNHYRKHWVGAYLQSQGVTVIPTIRCSTDERSLEWYLDGEPKDHQCGLLMMT